MLQADADVPTVHGGRSPNAPLQTPFLTCPCRRKAAAAHAAAGGRMRADRARRCSDPTLLKCFRDLAVPVQTQGSCALLQADADGPTVVRQLGSPNACLMFLS